MSETPKAAEATAATAATPVAAIPADKVQLTLLLVSGKRQTFLFDPKDTIEAVKTNVLANWPKGEIGLDGFLGFLLWWTS